MLGGVRDVEGADGCVRRLLPQRLREAVASDATELLHATLPILPVMAAAFPRSGIPGAVSVTEQAVGLLASVRREEAGGERQREGGAEGGDEGLDAVVDAAFQGIMEKVLLLEGVAT